MRPNVLRNRGRDLSLAWLAVFYLAVGVTLCFCTWLVCVFLNLIPVPFTDKHTIANAFEVNRWMFGILLFVIGYFAVIVREQSAYQALRNLDCHGLMSYLGAERVPYDTVDSYLRRLLNVNEEIAIAAGRSPAHLYRMEGETGINAFTAGVDRTEASICVTEGALRYLTRSELQAVVAHEYGHIASGDVRMNTSMIHWLAFLMPEGFAPRKSDYKQVLVIFAAMSCIFFMAGAIIRELAVIGLFSLVLVILGLVAWLPSRLVRWAWRAGANLARLSQAAHSREREFDADARSAEFTRDPGSLAEALRKIGGLRRGTHLRSDKAFMFSHMCIAPALVADDVGIWSSHPAIAERLNRLGFPLTPQERRKLGRQGRDVLTQYAADVNRELGIMQVSPAQVASEPQSPAMDVPGPTVDPALSAAEPLPPLSPASPAPSTGTRAPKKRQAVREALSATSDVASAVYLLDSIPAELRQALREPGGARVAARVLLGLAVTGDAAQEKLARDLSRTLAECGPRYRLPMLELAAPALRRLPRQDRAAFVSELRQGIEADGRITLQEFVYYLLISSELVSTPSVAPRSDAQAAFAMLLGTAAHAFTVHSQDAVASFEAGASVAGMPLAMPARGELSIQRLESAIACLRNLDGAGRRLAVDAIAAAIARDGTVSSTELEFVRAIGAAIDCPVALPPPARR